MVNIHMLRTKFKVLDISYGGGTGNLFFMVLFKFKVPGISYILQFLFSTIEIVRCVSHLKIPLSLCMGFF